MKLLTFKRTPHQTLAARLQEPRRFLQVVTGPRQVGKTVLVRQVLGEFPGRWHYASADEPTLGDRTWLAQQWDRARLLVREAGPHGAVLALDEIHKLPDWSETVKRLWDEDTLDGLPLKVVLLGSSPLLLDEGLAETLGGRFERIRLAHWSLSEMRAAFGWDLDTFVHFGGYPGAASLVEDEQRWRRYVVDALVETTIGRDILLTTRIAKPVLLRRLFLLGCQYSGQILSYQKMLGQLQDAGNTTTLAHYLDLLSAAGLLAGLQKFAGQRVRQRSSSPKLLALNGALSTALGGRGFAEARERPDVWGRQVESAVGAHLANDTIASETEVFYWRARNREVDFVVRHAGRVTAIEVKSGRRRGTLPGVEAFRKAFRPNRVLLVGSGGIPLDEFLSTPVAEWVG